MDGRKRRMLGCACVGLAAHLATPGPCPGQGQDAPPSEPVRASASSPSRPQRRVDAGVERSHFHEGRPSPQQQAPAPPIPSKPQPSYAPPEAPPSYPSYAPPAPPQPPQQPLQGYPPPYAGYAPPPPQYAPQQYMMVPVAPPAAAAPPANFFLPGAAPAAPAYGPPAGPPPAPMQPAYAMPMAPMAPAFAMPMAPAPPQAAAFGTGAALGGSSVSVPTSSSKTTVEVRGPGIFSAALARVGERMVQLGRTRVRTVHETVLQTPQSQPMGGTATIATAGLTPIQQPAAPPQAPQQYAPPQQEAPPESPAPSPQGTHGHAKPSMAHRLFGRD